MAAARQLDLRYLSPSSFSFFVVALVVFCLSGLEQLLVVNFFSSAAAAGEPEDCLRTFAHGADIFISIEHFVAKNLVLLRCNYPSLRGAFLVWIYVFCYANFQKHREQNFVCIFAIALALSLREKEKKKNKLSFLPKRAPREPSS